MQAGWRDLGSHRRCTVYCRKPIILPKLVIFFGTFLDLPAHPTVWKNRKSDAKITARAISTFLWFFLLNVFFGYIWWQIWVYFDFEAFLTVQWSPKVECPTQILTFSSFLPVFLVFLYHCGHLAQNAPQCTPQHLSYSFSCIKISKNWDGEVV